MPLQNRVTPFGEIVAIEQRGLFMGNRGIIHDPATRTLLARRWTNKAWITCVCEFRGVRRAVMSRRSWTELFFLDEATALAAGHRPCYYCRRAAATAFAQAWARARRSGSASATGIDAVLHAERLQVPGDIERRAAEHGSVRKVVEQHFAEDDHGVLAMPCHSGLADDGLCVDQFLQNVMIPFPQCHTCPMAGHTLQRPYISNY